MAALLSAAEYAAMVGKLRFPMQAFIDGSFRDSLSGKTSLTTNPATGEVLAEIIACNAQDVDLAVAHAKAAFDDGR